jgi:signal transduction histidine kinase
MVAVGEIPDLGGTLARIVQEAAELVDARYGALGLLDEGGRGSAGFVTAGLDGASLGPGSMGHPLLEELIRDAVPLRLDMRDHPASVGVPQGHPPTDTFLGVPVRVTTGVVGTLHVAGKRAGRFSVDDEEVITTFAAAAGVAVENARLRDRTRRLIAQSRGRRRWFEATGEITTALLAGADPGEVLVLVVQRAAELTGASGALITTPPQVVPVGDMPPPVRITAGVGLEEPFPAGGRLDVAGTVLEVAARTGSPQVADDLVLPGAPGRLGPGLVVPMRGGEEISGMLVVAGVEGADGCYYHDDLSLVSSFADQAALVLRLAESQRARRQLDVVTDRERIAADLHDHVLQRLFALGLGLQAAHSRLPASDAARRVDAAVDQIDGIIRDIRTSIFDLHTVRGGDDLGTRVRIAATEMSADDDLVPIVRLSGAVAQVPEDLAVAVEAVVREGVSNAIRHAAPSEITVTVSADSTLTVEVTDDGIGIPETIARSGLANLAARARAAGGDARVDRRVVGAGTRLTWWVPLGRSRADDPADESCSLYATGESHR